MELINMKSETVRWPDRMITGYRMLFSMGDEKGNTEIQFYLAAKEGCDSRALAESLRQLADLCEQGKGNYDSKTPLQWIG